MPPSGASSANVTESPDEAKPAAKPRPVNPWWSVATPGPFNCSDSASQSAPNAQAGAVWPAHGWPCTTCLPALSCTVRLSAVNAPEPTR